VSRKLGPEGTENTHMNFMSRFYAKIPVNMALAWAIKLTIFFYKHDNNLRGLLGFLTTGDYKRSRYYFMKRLLMKVAVVCDMTTCGRVAGTSVFT
jgi:hypothetical protein